MPMIEHGIYDSALSLDADWIFVFFFLFVIAVDVWALKFVKSSLGRTGSYLHKDCVKNP